MSRKRMGIVENFGLRFRSSRIYVKREELEKIKLKTLRSLRIQSMCKAELSMRETLG